MRLGQFARKYDIRVQDLISYLESDSNEEIHSNTKLSEEEENSVLDFFGIEPEELAPDPLPIVETIAESKSKEEDVAEIESNDTLVKAEWDANDSGYETSLDSSLHETPLEEIASVNGEIEIKSSKEDESIKADVPAEVVNQVVDTPAQDEVIQTDKLLEMLESEENPADLDKIKLIKAPKKELSGLKVLGKVELPEPKKKEDKKKEPPTESEFVTEKDLREYRHPRKKRQPLTAEEKEKRRLKAKRKQEEYEARKEKRRKQKESQEKKARKEAHYKQKLDSVKAVKEKRKAKEQTPVLIENTDKRPAPKTILGKFWRWMNT
ncbi:hypothetical protein [Ekhidna sp.]